MKKAVAPKISEKHIQETCDAFLILDGWRAIVTDPPHMRGLGVTEKGICDRLYIRYEPRREHYPLHACTNVEWFNRSRAEVVWIEWKKKGGKAALHQKDWHTAERARGALVWVAGEDFLATIEDFQEHYMASGLNRRIAQPRLKVALGSKA